MPKKFLLWMMLMGMGACCLCDAQMRGSQQQKQQTPKISRGVVEPPATVPNADYPLKVHILDGESANVNGTTAGVGSGNLLGDKPLGFDYTFECDGAVGPNTDPDAFYQAKWKKQDKEMELLTQAPELNKVHKCKLKVGMRTAAYTDDNKPPPLPSVAGLRGARKKQ